MFMVVNNPHSVDRYYKFIYKLFEIKFHKYFYQEGSEIKFTETEIQNTGQRKDIVVKIDNNRIRITEFMSKALYNDKLKDLHQYYDHSTHDSQNEGMEVNISVISTANPNHGKTSVKINQYITFHIKPIFIKEMNGREMLSTLKDKCKKQEQFTDNDAISLLILPDTDIDMPIKKICSEIFTLIGKCKMKDEKFKNNIIIAEIKFLSRFFKGEELKEMIKMLKSQTNNSEIDKIVEKYGPGFDSIYFDGKADGIEEGIKEGIKEGRKEGRDDGFSDAKREIARNLLADGFDEKTVSRNTGMSIDELKKL